MHFKISWVSKSLQNMALNLYVSSQIIKDKTISWRAGKQLGFAAVFTSPFGTQMMLKSVFAPFFMELPTLSSYRAKQLLTHLTLEEKLLKASCTFNAQSGIASVPALGLLIKGGYAGTFLLVDFSVNGLVKALASHWQKEKDCYRRGKYWRGHFLFWRCMPNLKFLLKGQHMWLGWRERKQVVGMISEIIRFNKL